MFGQDIRPEILRKEYNNLRFEAAIKMAKQKNEFVYVNCPACGLGEYKKNFEKEGFDFVSCNSCETLFVNPRPISKMLHGFYKDSECFNFWSKIFIVSEEARRKHIFYPRVSRVREICLKYNQKNDALLDVGAGYGIFCEEIQKIKLFKSVIALEPSQEFAKMCRKKGLEVIEEFIENVKLDNGVDVITSFELIEHLFDPKLFLKKCSEILKKDGMLILTTPNIKGFDLDLLGRLSDNIVAPNHINYFNIQSLTLLLNACGFEVLEVTTPGSLDAEMVRNSVLSGELDITDNKFLKHVLLDNWGELGESFQKFISMNLLSSHMQIVAKKC